MSYAEATLEDRNAIKRLLQRRRLRDALACIEKGLSPDIIVDFGGGIGEFSKWLEKRYPRARIYCYEPSPWMTNEAEENLAGTQRISFISSLDEIPKGKADLLFCNEVFEHFPPGQMEIAIGQIKELMRDDGSAVIGVPIEVFIPALFKGMFRMTRRYGDYDATVHRVLRAFLGVPAKDRPLADSGAPDLPWHFRHMGFDHRPFRRRLERDFVIVRTRTSPLPWLGAVLNNEIYYILRKAAGGSK